MIYVICIKNNARFAIEIMYYPVKEKFKFFDW